MDLGLSTLTDDQLLNLLQEACGEVAKRDPVCRKLAQQTITTQADLLATLRGALDRAATETKKRYLSELARETYNAALEEAREQSRKRRPVPVSEEMLVIGEAIREAKEASLCELEREVLNRATADAFSLTYQNGNMSIFAGGRQVNTRGVFEIRDPRGFISAIRTAMGV